jgi:hypothetical protein
MSEIDIGTLIRDMFLAKYSRRQIATEARTVCGTKFTETYKKIREIEKQYAYRSEVIIGKVTRDEKKKEPQVIELRYWILSSTEIDEAELWRNFNKMTEAAQLRWMQFDFSSFRALNAEYNIRVTDSADDEYHVAIRINNGRWYYETEW